VQYIRIHAVIWQSPV